MNVCPEIVSVPVRWDAVGLAAMEYDTVPLPLPAAPAVIVIQETALVADHVQPEMPVTATVPVDAVPLTDTLVGEIDELHGDENENVLDSALRPTPLGPTAATRAS